MLNRRNIIGGAAALPAIVIAPCGIAKAAPATVSPGLAALLAKAAQTAAEAADYDQRVYLPTLKAVTTVIDRIPHTAVTIDGKAGYFSTANDGAMKLASRLVEEDVERRLPDSAALRKLVAADKLRDRTLRQIQTRHGLAAAGDRSDKLSEACSAAENAIAEYPVSTAADLAAKLTFMVERRMGDGMDWLEELHADARRIAGTEG
jgi:hypothetical protein